MAVAGVVVAGGRSTRMGSAKAALEWQGTTLLARTCATVARSVAGPVVVVRAAMQELPELPSDVTVVDDPRPELGPLQGVAAGLAAAGPHAAAAVVCATDLPFLHEAVVRRVVAELLEPAEPRWEVAVPVVGGAWQPLLAAYRTSLAAAADDAVAAGRLSVRAFAATRHVRLLYEARLLADPAVARDDPRLDSFVNVNDRDELARARAARRG